MSKTLVQPSRRTGTPFAALVSLALAGCPMAPDLGPTVATRSFVDLVEVSKWHNLTAEGEEPAFRADKPNERLIVKRGKRIDLFFRAPEPAWLSFDRWGIRSGSKLAPTIVFQRDGGDEVLLRIPPDDRKANGANQGRYLIPLPVGGSEIARLTIGAPDTGKDGDALILWRPRIEGLPEAKSLIAENVSPAPDTDSETAKPPNLIIYLVDTLRKDHLGVYGYQRPVSPELDGFAEGATVYDNAFAQSTWTRPAVASILTGLEPHIHGVNERPDSLPDEARTLAEILKSDGYQTAAFITNGNVSDEFNFAQGFDLFSRSFNLRDFSHQLNERVFRYFEETPISEPLFLYAHTVDAHGPYAPFEPYRSRFAGHVDLSVGTHEFLRQFRWRGGIDGNPPGQVVRDAKDLYDAEIAHNDEHFGHFIDFLVDRGLYDNSWIVFTADHGEEFWEHGDWSHGQSLYSEQLDIPLVIKAPHQTEGRRSDVLTQQIDIFATALDYAVSDAQIKLRGRSLRRSYLPKNPDLGVFSMLQVDGRKAMCVIYDDWKLIVPKTGNMGTRPYLFNRRTDPGDTENLYEQRRIVAEFMHGLLRRHYSDRSLLIAPKQENMSDELIRQLKALGYIDE
ncbi:MAG: sulfatase [Thermoanaerobaculia bacterium]|nr:sulfatase [Thermoanaerobaculia bacterium]